MKDLFGLLDEHAEELRSLNYSPATLRQLRYVGRDFIRQVQSRGVGGPERIRARHVRLWQRRLAARPSNRGKPLSPRTLAKHAEVVRGFLGFLVRRGLVPPSLPAAVRNVRQPHLLPGGVLPHARMRRLLDGVATDTLAGQRTRTMLEVLYSSGMRVAELLGLDVDRVDFAAGTALIMGKGRKERVVPIGRTALRLLEAYLRAVRPCLCEDPEQKAMFVNAAGRRVRYPNFRRTVMDCARRAGIEAPVTPHTFRRSCTTELLRGGANMYHVKELLGHESLDTLKHYARLTIVDLKATHARCHPREKDEKERGAEHSG